MGATQSANINGCIKGDNDQDVGMMENGRVTKSATRKAALHAHKALNKIEYADRAKVVLPFIVEQHLEHRGDQDRAVGDSIVSLGGDCTILLNIMIQK